MKSEMHPTQEERLLAALAHGTIITAYFAPVASILIYVTQKEKSAYVAGQALQAAVYQLGGILLMIVGWVLWSICYTLSLVPLIASADRYADAPPPLFWAGLASMLCPLIFMLLWGLYGLYGALRAWSGADFRYAFVGNRVLSRFHTAY